LRNDRTAKRAKREYDRSTQRPTKGPAVRSANIGVSPVLCADDG
jgi:hypothetical protein